MNRILVYPQSIAPDVIARAFPAEEPLLVHSKSECADALVHGPSIDRLIVQRDAYGPEYQSFFSSLRLHFPFLEIVLIAPLGPTPLPNGCHFIDGSEEPAKISAAIAALSRAPRLADQRHGIRFDWPLRGQLSSAGRETACKVRDFSCTGAFLETDAALQVGDGAALKVEFLNSRMTVSCEIIRVRAAGPVEPGGYGVCFLDLSGSARELSERIVRDAVVQALLHPEQETAVPALSEEDLVNPGFD